MSSSFNASSIHRLLKGGLLAIPVTLVVIGMAFGGYTLVIGTDPHPEPPSPATPQPGDSGLAEPAAGLPVSGTDEPPTRGDPAGHPPQARAGNTSLSLEEFSRLIEQLIRSDRSDHRSFYLSLRDPIGFIDELMRLRHEVARGATRNPAAPPPQTPRIRVATTGVSATNPDDQFPALPARIRLDIEPGPLPVAGHHVLRWVNSETAEVEHMTRIHIPGNRQEPLIIDTGPLGGQTGAWHLELYQARDGLPRVARIPITVGSEHMVSRREDTP